MVRVTLKRILYDAGATLGILMVENKPDPIWFTVERPWMDNQPKISCIPTGTYTVAPHNGDKYKDVWEIQGVPGRDAILFHPANYAGQLEGCIAPGLSMGYIAIEGALHKGVTGSRLAIGEMKKILGYPSTFTLIVMD